MTSSAPHISDSALSHPELSGSAVNGDLRGPVRLALLGFAVFLIGTATTMIAAGLFSPLLLAIAAVVNLVAMLSICALTAIALDLGAAHSAHAGGGPGWRQRIARRALQLAAVFWAAAGLAFLLSPMLARL